MKLDRRRFLGSAVGMAATAGDDGRMGLAEALRLVSETSFICSGAECGRVLREDRGAPSGWIAAVPSEGAWQVGSPQTKSGGRFAGTRKHERDSYRSGGTIASFVSAPPVL